MVACSCHGSGCVKTTVLLGAATLVSTSIALWSAYKLIKEKLFDTRTKENSEKTISDMLMSSYGKQSELCTFVWLPKETLKSHVKCAEICATFTKKSGSSRVLDFGCGTGRISFELCRFFEKVIGVDFDNASIAACHQLKLFGSLVYSVVDTGDVRSDHLAQVDPSIDRTRVHFGLEDVTNLSPSLGKFDCILVSTFLEEFANPHTLLEDLREFLRPRGTLMIISSYNWNAKTTKKEEWLGGTLTSDGEKVSGFQALQSELLEYFDFIEKSDLPFVKRQTTRCFTLVIAQATLWRRKS